MQNPKDNIPQVMQTLSKYFKNTDRTTLNSMRHNGDPFKILIGCLLSLRAKDETTNKITDELFKLIHTPEELIKIPDNELKKIIFSTGHFNKKCLALKSVSNELIQRFKSKVPKTKEELLSIKHIGPKTANIVLNFAFNQPYIPVDVHVHIISNRLGWVKTKTAEKTEPELEKVLPRKYWGEINGLFVLLGRETCQTFSPKCSICPIKKFCPRIGVIRSR
ncbi:MAG: endonuclease III domain-containing protein [Candidatus Nanoarchaeia archaeon]